MADTSTTLNPGVGGDVMNESLVQNTSGASVKSPRVVLVNDLGVLADPSLRQTALELILRELRAHTILLQSILANGHVSPMSTDEAYALAAETHGD